MTHLPAPPAEPRHSRGGAGGVGGRGQWVKYPLRLVLDAEAYADADTKVYGKVKALSRGRACEASVEKLADFTGLGVSTVQKSLRRLSSPAPTDGVQELTRRQRSHRGTGTGRTNERTCRSLDDGERYVCAPVRAADTLRGTLHRLYLLLRYTTFVEKRELTLAEIAAVLRHHGGESAGQPLHDTTAGRLLDELEDRGWITQDKRAGYRARHAITVHDDPVSPAGQPDGPPPMTGPGAGASPDAEGGAAPDHEGGAPAYKEDLQLNDPGTTDRAGGSFRRRRADRSSATPRDYYPVTPSAGPSAAPAAPATFRPAVRPAYAGPPLTLGADAWALLGPVLAPVKDLLPRVSVFMTRRIVRELMRQIRDEGIWPDDIRDQITRLRTWTPDEDIRDPGRWLLGAVLPVRSRCGMTGCHWGFLAHTGTPCKACADHRTHPAPAPSPPPAARGREKRQAPPPHAIPHATQPSGPSSSRIGPPPVPGGWRALVARERPHDAARAYRHRWRGDHARHLPPDTA